MRAPARPLLLIFTIAAGLTALGAGVEPVLFGTEALGYVHFFSAPLCGLVGGLAAAYIAYHRRVTWLGLAAVLGGFAAGALSGWLCWLAAADELESLLPWILVLSGVPLAAGYILPIAWIAFGRGIDQVAERFHDRRRRWWQRRQDRR